MKAKNNYCFRNMQDKKKKQGNTQATRINSGKDFYNLTLEIIYFF